jgi:hypothetical protein
MMADEGARTFWGNLYKPERQEAKQPEAGIDAKQGAANRPPKT